MAESQEMNVDDLVSNAKLAEQAERYDDMAAAMKEVAAPSPLLSLFRLRASNSLRPASKRT